MTTYLLLLRRCDDTPTTKLYYLRHYLLPTCELKSLYHFNHFIFTHRCPQGRVLSLTGNGCKFLIMCYHKKLLMMTFVFKTMGISLKKSERGLFSDAVKTILHACMLKFGFFNDASLVLCRRSWCWIQMCILGSAAGRFSSRSWPVKIKLVRCNDECIVQQIKLWRITVVFRS